MATLGIFLVKTFTYRGNPEEWGNGYHLFGSAPGGPSDWRNIVDELVANERHLYTSNVSAIRALCYDDYSPGHSSIYTYQLADFAGPVAGDLSLGVASHECPGDDAVWAAWDTGKLSSRGKPIWLRKYFHPGWVHNGDIDAVASEQVTALNTFATWAPEPGTYWPGIADKDGDLPTGGTRVSLSVTTRTLKRRGRRPTS